MSNTNTLPPELEAQIDAEATNKTMKLPANNSFDVGYMQGMENGYIAGATEYASKLHLLRQELNGLRDDINNLESNEIIQQDRFEVLQQEYDKLEGDNRMLEADHYELKREFESLETAAIEQSGRLVELSVEHEALKEKAHALMSAVNKAYGTLMGGQPRDTAATLNILNKAACAYNSNTNKPGVYIGNPKGYCHDCGFPVDECNCEDQTNNQNENNG